MEAYTTKTSFITISLDISLLFPLFLLLFVSRHLKFDMDPNLKPLVTDTSHSHH